MKTIAIDITHYERMSGYGVVTRNIVKGLLQADPDNFYVLISHTHQNVENLKEFKNRKFVNTNENFTLYKFFTLPKYLKKHNVEVFLSLDQTLPFKKVCKYLIVEHDIVYQRMGKRNLLKNFFMNKHIRRLTFLYYFLDFEKLWLKKADTIITPSQFTKEELIQYYHIRPEKINVVYRGMDYTFYSNKQYKKKNQILFPFPSLHSDFAFKLANELLEKRIIESIVMTKPGFPNIPLHPGIKIVRGRISDAENERYYKESLLSIYLSDYDGFGIAPLESMWYGTPVIYNDIPCVKEVSDKGGIACKLDIGEIITKIKEILINKSIYILTIKQGTQTVQKYRRDDTIQSLLSLLK